MMGRISAPQHKHTPAQHALAPTDSVFVAALNVPPGCTKHFGKRGAKVIRGTNISTSFTENKAKLARHCRS